MTRDRRTIIPTPRRRTPAHVATWLGALAVLTTGAAHAAQRSLTDIEHTTLPGERVRVTLTLSGPAPEPETFTVDQPARLSMDLANTSLAVDQRRRTIDVGSIQSITLAEGDDRTRLVVKMSHLVPHQTNVSGNTIELEVGAGKAKRRLSKAARPSERDKPGEPEAQTQQAAGIENVDFRRAETGAGRVAITLGQPRAPVDVSAEGGTVIARFPDARLPERLVKRLDVIDFATPVKYVDAVNKPDGARIRIEPIADASFDRVAYQSEERFIIELQPVTKAERQKRQAQEEEYTGERISLSFQNVEIRALLQIIAEVAEVNMVVSESVSGSMALQLDNVPWDQALDIILSSEGLGMRREGNVITVAPLQEIAQREKRELEAEQATKNLAPLTSEILQINYAKAGDIQQLLQSGETSLVTERGSVTVDQRTNTLLVRETRENLAEIRRLIDRLDVPVRQVLIESRIVVANRDFARKLGVRVSDAQNLQQRQGSDSQSGSQSQSGGVLPPATDQGSFESSTGGNYQTESGFAVNLPVGSPAGTLSATVIGDSFQLGLELSAMESEDKGEIVSSPRVITANAQEASIEQGQEIPYLEAASSGAATVQFKEAVLSLNVTPQITPDESVIMDLTVNQDSQGQNVNVQGGGSVPAIDTRTLTTRLLVDNGETVVLGGIYQEEDRNTVSKVPVLGDIPLIGALFRSTNRQRNKSELLIFVTPKILKQGLNVD